MLEGLIDADTNFTLCLLPDADGNSRPPMVKSIWEIFNIMEINDKKVWICMSTGSNGMSSYFSSMAQEISEHVAAFIACLGAQVYWWLRHRGCITADINNLIMNCFILSVAPILNNDQLYITGAGEYLEPGLFILDPWGFIVYNFLL